MGQVYMQLEMERFIELKKAEEENKKLREALEFYTNVDLYPDEDLSVIARIALAGGEALD
ncbi:hypothetical protein ACIQXG_19440 [Lysinibacillus sphaericus]|uniref:hypothetical protein n=1 Tax=Lysinibacillus sphaericus TaxID=1421 RepID=UPI003805E204